RARFADPTNPDRPPMPPDDEAAWALSPHPQKPGKSGVATVEGTGYLDLLAMWDATNREEAATASAKKDAGAGSEPGTEAGKGYTTGPAAAPRTALSAEPKPGAPLPYLLKLEQAVELGLINSREYQDTREDLYLTALPVTLERFSFAAQFFAAG